MRSRISALVLAGAFSAAALLAPSDGQSARGADPVVTVRPGDTLTRIAREQGVSIDELVTLNRLRNPDRIYAGQVLRVRETATAPSQPAPAAPPAEPASHRVRAGEHLTGIARRYGTSVGAIAAANGLSNPSFIRAGMTLTIPVATRPAAGASTPAAPPAQPASHRVRAGEHLTGIARRYGTSVGAIAAANGLSNPSFIRAGMTLTIPVAATETSKPAEASGRPMPASMAKLVASRQEMRRIIEAEAEAFRVPPAFALAVAWQESGWQQGVVSRAGAIGVMQLLPATADWIEQSILRESVDPRSARSNVRAGVSLLRHYLDRYGDRRLALAAYYQGQRGTDRHGIYPSSQPYIASILLLEEIFASR
jgi:N-acetylmuramoyl-L-alanine amidase